MQEAHGTVRDGLPMAGLLQVRREVVELCLVEDGEAEQPRLVVL